MKIRKIFIFMVAFAFYVQTVCASGAPNQCDEELRELIVPAFKHVAMDKMEVQAELDEHKNNVYSIRLFVPADSPDNLNGQVSIGWVNLDVDGLKIFDVTNDPENKETLDVDQRKYEKFVKMCIPHGEKTVTGKIDCRALSDSSEKQGIFILGENSGREVIGNGRLQFYSAPNCSCKMPSVFILASETVIAYTTFGRFTSVAYLNGKESGPVIGWVESNRLKSNGLGVAPQQ